MDLGPVHYNFRHIDGNLRSTTMGSIIMKSAGPLKFYDADKGFGFVATKDGDVRIAKDVVGSRVAELVKGVEVEVAFIHQVHNGKPGFNATRIDSIVPPAPKPVTPERITLLAIVERFDVKRKGWVVRIPDAGFSAPQAYLSPKVCDRIGFIPDPADILRVTVADGMPSPYVTTFSFGEEVDAAWAAQMGDIHAEDGAAVEADPAVDAMLEEYRISTMADIGQLPAAAEEAPVVVAVKAAKPKRVKTATKPPKATSIDAGLSVHADSMPPNCLLAGLVALTSPGNGAVVSH